MNRIKVVTGGKKASQESCDALYVAYVGAERRASLTKLFLPGK